MRLKNLVIFIILLFNLSCLKADENIPPTNFKLVKELLDDGFKFKIGNTVEEVKNNLGEPNKIKTAKLVWVEDKMYDIGKFYTLIYEGIEIEIYKHNETKEQFLTRVSITSNKYPIKYKIKIGIKKETLLKLLGDFNGGNDNNFWYSIYVKNEPDLVNKFKNYWHIGLYFFLKDKKINKILFMYECDYTDGGTRVEIN